MPGMASASGHAGGTHQLLLNQLRNLDRTCSASQKVRGRVLAAKLDALRVRRVVADYKLGETLSASEVKQQQAETHALFADCAAPC